MSNTTHITNAARDAGRMTGQAIYTRCLPATNTRDSRVRAVCEAGSLTIDYPHELSGADCHIAAADALCRKLADEQAKRHGTEDAGRTWLAPRVCGGLPHGDYAHVFIA